MTAMVSVLNDAVNRQDVPFLVAMTGSTDGVTFSHAVGDAAEGRPAAENTAFRIFSMTKAVGSVAAAILIDRGLLTLDTPVAEVLPAWNDMQVLDGWDGDTPVTCPQATVATIRHLATHTSGLEYENWSADMARWLNVTGNKMVTSGLKSSLQLILTSDPSTRWGYGPSIDWLGQVVEAVDGRRIDQFCRDEIFDPLGMVDTVFEPNGLQDRLAGVMARDGDGLKPLNVAPPAQPEFYGMGHALYSTAPDYLTFLRMVLNRGQLNGARILSPEGCDILFQDQMRGGSFRRMVSVNPRLTADVDYRARRITHSFMALRNEDDWPGKRSAGSLSWAGLCNTHFWIDPQKDLCAVLMTQSLPFLDPRFARVYDAFERAVYAGQSATT